MSMAGWALPPNMIGRHAPGAETCSEASPHRVPTCSMWENNAGMAVYVHAKVLRNHDQWACVVATTSTDDFVDHTTANLSFVARIGRGTGVRLRATCGWRDDARTLGPAAATAAKGRRSLARPGHAVEEIIAAAECLGTRWGMPRDVRAENTGRWSHKRRNWAVEPGLWAEAAYRFIYDHGTAVPGGATGRTE